jgi:hypothetical protein
MGDAAARPIPTNACAPRVIPRGPFGLETECACTERMCTRDVLAARQKKLRRPIPPRDHVLCELLLYRNRIPAATPARVKRENCKNRYCIAPTARIIIVSQAPAVIWGSHGGAQARGAHTGGSSCARVRKCGYGGHSNAYETRAKPKSQIITSQFSFTSCMQSSVHSVPGLGHALPGNG